MITDVPTLLWIAAGLLIFLLIWKILKKIIIALIIGLAIIVGGLIIAGRMW